MMLEIIKIALSLLLVFYLPGYLLSLIIAKKLSSVERICLAIGLSLSIIIMIGINLSLIGHISGTKAITGKNLWISLLMICSVFSCIILIMQYYAKTRPVSD